MIPVRENSEVVMKFTQFYGCNENLSWTLYSMNDKLQDAKGSP